MNFDTLRKPDYLPSAFAVVVLIGLKSGTNFIDSASLLLLMLVFLKLAFDFVVRLKRQIPSFLGVLKALMIVLNVTGLSIYAFFYCNLKLNNLASFGDDQSTFLNVIGRVGNNVDGAEYSEGGVGTYTYLSVVKNVGSYLISTDKNLAVYALYFSWLFGLVLLMFAGSIATVSRFSFERRSFGFVVTALVFVDVLLISAFQAILNSGYLSLLLTLICLILGVSFISDSKGFFGVGFRNPLLYFWLALLAWWPLYVFLLVITPVVVLEAIRKKRVGVSLLHLPNNMLMLAVLVINFYYSILQGKSMRFLISTAATGNSFSLDIPVVEIALLISIVVVYFVLREVGWCARAIFFAANAGFLTIFKFDDYSSNYGMSKIAITVSVSSAIAGIAWLVSFAQKLTHDGPLFNRALIYFLLLLIPISHIFGNYKSHAGAVGLVQVTENFAPIERAWFVNLAETRVESSPELCVFFEVKEPLSQDMESYLCSKWSSAQKGNLNSTSIDWGQAFLSGDRSIKRLQNLKAYIEDNNIVIAVDNKELAQTSVDPLVIVARNSTALVEVK